MKWITAGNLKNWAENEQRRCQDTLPELIRRLILAHAVNSVDEFDFPSGDSVAMGGWDGRLKTQVKSPFFPAGSSGWEIGTEKSALTKAEKDYTKRTSDPLGLTLKDTTFMFVTPRSWPGKTKWQATKLSEGKWKDVRVVSADGLEQWLDVTPAVALWLARQIGCIVSDGIRDLEAFWEEWSLGTDPVMTPELVIGGRAKDVEVIKRWIIGQPQLLEVEADHPDESIAFLYSTINSLPDTERLQSLSRCVIVEKSSELRNLTIAYQNYPLIIVAPGECIDAARIAVKKGHHVFIAMDGKVIGIRDSLVRLSRPQRSVVETILRKSGLSQDKAQKISRDFGRSIPVLRRSLSRSSTVRAPVWTAAETAQILIPVLFAGAWNEGKEGDRQIMELLSGMCYNDLVNKLQPLLTIEDAPLHKIGSIWMLKSPLDAWFLLSRNLNNESLKLFKKAVITVLTKTDPKYDLSAEKRWASAIYGKSNNYSNWLRSGLVESLVLIAVYGDRSPSVHSTQVFVDTVTNEILNSANKWKQWASLSDVTPLLAEASPVVFADIVEQTIKKNPKLFQEFMKDEPGLFGECKHSGLLWALESIAWSPDYFVAAVNILSLLSNIDPGGKWANRPIGSLKDLFMPTYPQTYASPEDRIAALQKLIDRDPKMVWNFAEGYYTGGTFSEAARFRWRDDGGERRGLEPEEKENNLRYIKELFPKLSDLACAKENAVLTANEFTRLPPDVQDRFLEVLELTDLSTFSKEDQTLILKNLRHALNWINSYGNEELREKAARLNSILKKFTPDDVFERVGWLLNTPWPRLPEGESSEYNVKQDAIKEAQENAARELLIHASLDKIVQFSKTLQYPGVLGYAIGSIVKKGKEDNELLDAMIELIIDSPIVIRAYAEARVQKTGEEWINKQIHRLKTKGSYSDEGCALLHFGLPENAKTWSKVSKYGKEVENAYWKRATGSSRTDKGKDAIIAVEKLLDAKRPNAALSIAGDPQLLLPSALLQRLLQEILEVDPKEEKNRINSLDEYNLGNVFKQLYERDELSLEELAALEWPFANYFDQIRHYTSKPLALHRLLQKDPSFFTQFISFIYKRDDHSLDPNLKDVNPKILENRAKGAYQIFESWNLVPGLKDDGTFDEKELTEWVKTARNLCAEAKLVTGGDLQIALILSHAPGGSDGAWPHIAIRNQIEVLNNNIIDRHIEVDIRNSRGVTTRGLNDGGRQERELSEKYKKMSEIVKVKWPRTSRILRSIAESYQQDAKSEDTLSDLNDIRWG